MQPQVLIVEDEQEWRLRLQNLVSQTLSRDLHPLVRPAVVRLSDNPGHAIECLRTQNLIGSPIDLVLLDLELKQPDSGLKVLKEIRETGCAREVIVVSQTLMNAGWEQRVPRIIQGGVADLFTKFPFNPEEIQDGILRSLRRTIALRSSLILQQRLRDLALPAEQGIAYVLSLSSSNCIQEVGRAHSMLRSEIGERLGLTRQDSGDLMVQQLIAIDRALQKFKSEWSAQQDALGLNREAKPRRLELQREFENMQALIEPCLITKNASIEWPGDDQLSPVLGFDGDVQAVLCEMILGALNDSLDFKERATKLQFSAAIKEDWLEIKMHDDLRPLEPGDVQTINQRAGISRETRFGRAWGLSIMRHVALRGAGRLAVVCSGEPGTTLTYCIPLAPNG